MHCSETQTITAKKQHRCMSCGEAIAAGEQYRKWTCFDDGSASTNKMHLECFAAHEECATYYGDSEWEYTPYSYQRGSAEA